MRRIFFRRQGINHHEQPSEGIASKSHEPLFMGGIELRLGKSELVLEHESGISEVNAILAEVLGRLLLISFELHRQGLYARLCTLCQPPTAAFPVTRSGTLRLVTASAVPSAPLRRL